MWNFHGPLFWLSILEFPRGVIQVSRKVYPHAPLVLKKNNLRHAKKIHDGQSELPEQRYLKMGRAPPPAPPWIFSQIVQCL